MIVRKPVVIRKSVVALAAAVLVFTGASAASAVDPSDFTTVPSPIITGTAAVGETLSASFDSSAVNPTADSAFLTWFVDGVNIGNSDALGLWPADLGKVITVRLTVLKAGYNNGVAYSEATLPVAPGTQSFTPVIAGSVAYGYTLSVKGLPSDATFTYKWKRGTSSISGATKSTYKLTSSDIGKAISVTVTSTKPGYTTLARSSAATAAVKRVFTSASTPVISGTAKVGYTLKATTKAWSPGATLKYQWYRDGVAIPGATASTRKLGTTDAGVIITVKVTGSRTGYLTLTRTSKATTVVSKGTISALVPVISGTARAGSTLKVTVGSTTPQFTDRAFQWYRNGVAIEGATNGTYGLKNVDAGKKITFKVTFTTPGYTTRSLTSAPTATIATRSASMSGTTAYSPFDGSYNYVAAGIYLTNSATPDCYWARDADDDPTNGVIVAYDFGARWIVEVAPTDHIFFTEDCGSWIKYDGTGSNATTITKNGYYGVGVDIKPGQYQQSGDASECYATLESNASNEPSAIVWEANPLAGAVITIDSATAPFFTTWNCGTWTWIGAVPGP